jgi:hypothetical protein
MLLRLFPVEGVDVGGASFAEDDGGVVGGEGERGITEAAGEREMGEVDDLCGFSVGEMKFDDSAVAAAAEDVDRLAIPREGGPTVKAGAELCPLLGSKIGNEKASLVTGEAGDVAAIGRPSWRIESLRSRESGELVCL